MAAPPLNHTYPGAGRGEDERVFPHCAGAGAIDLGDGEYVPTVRVSYMRRYMRIDRSIHGSCLVFVWVGVY